MVEPTPSKRRTTITGKKILEHLNHNVKVFLDNGITLNGVLLDYFYDSAEREGVLTLSSQQPGGEPTTVFRRFITAVQRSDSAQQKKKSP